MSYYWKMKKKDKNNLDNYEGMFAHAEIIPMVEKEDEEFLLRDEDIDTSIPLLPMRDNVLFPGVVMPVMVSREKSERLLRYAHEGKHQIAVFAQRNDVEVPEEGDLYRVGVVARVLKLIDLPNGRLMAVIQGSSKCNLINMLPDANQIDYARVVTVEDVVKSAVPEKLHVKVLRLAKMYTAILKMKNVAAELASGLSQIGSDKILVNFTSKVTIEGEVATLRLGDDAGLILGQSHLNEGVLVVLFGGGRRQAEGREETAPPVLPLPRANEDAEGDVGSRGEGAGLVGAGGVVLLPQQYRHGVVVALGLNDGERGGLQLGQGEARLVQRGADHCQAVLQLIQHTGEGRQVGGGVADGFGIDGIFVLINGDLGRGRTGINNQTLNSHNFPLFF